MGILDSIQSGINKGMESTGRATRSLQLKSNLKDAERKRESLCAQLGASLYEETRHNPAFRTSREILYAAIEDVDRNRSTIREEIEQLEHESKAAAQSAMIITCPTCGKTISATDAFCTGCGTNINAIRASLALCVNCGAPLTPDTAFCTACGTPVAASSAKAEIPEQVLPAPQTESISAVASIASEHDALQPGAQSQAGFAPTPQLVSEAEPRLSESRFEFESTEETKLQEEDSKTCSSCGAVLKKDVAFCTACGTSQYR
jgi:uncharacterized OB-fold protein